MKKITVYLLLLSFAACTNNEEKYLSKAEMGGLSSQSLSMNELNNKIYFPILNCKIPEQQDQQFYRNVMSLTQMLDTMAVEYIKLTGGDTTGEYELVNSTQSGENSYKIYTQKLNKDRLKYLVNEIKTKAEPQNKELGSQIAGIINYFFLGEKPYFNEARLKTLPYHLISLEFSTIERNIHAYVIKHITDKECATPETAPAADTSGN